MPEEKQLAQIWWKYKQIWEVQTQIRINTKENKHTNTNTYHSHIAQTRYKEKILNAVRGKKDTVKYKDITDSTDESEQEQMSLSKLRRDDEGQLCVLQSVGQRAGHDWATTKYKVVKDKNDNRLLLRNYASYKSMKHYL